MFKSYYFLNYVFDFYSPFVKLSGMTHHQHVDLVHLLAQLRDLQLQIDLFPLVSVRLLHRRFETGSQMLCLVSGLIPFRSNFAPLFAPVRSAIGPPLHGFLHLGGTGSGLLEFTLALGLRRESDEKKFKNKYKYSTEERKKLLYFILFHLSSLPFVFAISRRHRSAHSQSTTTTIRTA